MASWHARNRDQVRARRQQYARLNREKLIAYCRQWRIDNAEKYHRTLVKYREKNRQKLRLRQREYVRRNPEKVRAYFDANREKLRAKEKLARQSKAFKIRNLNNSHQRRARERQNPATATNLEVSGFLKKAKRCYYCGNRFGADLPATIDHVIAVSKGGAHSLDNFAAACKSCNSIKRDKDTRVIAQRFGLLPL